MPNQSKDHRALWGDYYKKLTASYLFPNEFVTRTFLGNYPHLNLPKDYSGKSICDVGCGDGRNIVALNRFGFQISGTEVSDEVCQMTRQKLQNHPDRIVANIVPGLNHALPFQENTFDYLLSWNACYYLMDQNSRIQESIQEHARILKPGGYLIASVPGPGCFTLQGAKPLDDGRVQLQGQQKWDILNDQIFQLFQNHHDIQERFGLNFENFHEATIDDDCFGIRLHYFIFVCQKRT